MRGCKWGMVLAKCLCHPASTLLGPEHGHSHSITHEETIADAAYRNEILLQMWFKVYQDSLFLISSMSNQSPEW